MNIVILNAHLGNIGDEAALTAVIADIKSLEPDATISIIYNSSGQPTEELINKDINHYFPVDLKINKRLMLWTLIPALVFKQPKYIPQNFLMLVSILKNADLIIGAPCGLNLGRYADVPFLTRLIVAKVLRKPILIYPSSYDKPAKMMYRLIARHILDYCQVMVRESQSYVYLIGQKIYPQQCLDVAFALPDASGYPLPEILQPATSYSVIIASEITSWHPNAVSPVETLVNDELRKVVDYEREQQRHVILLGHLVGTKKEDRYFQSIVDSMSEANISIIIPDNYKQYEAIISHSHSVITMRYHGIVFAMKYGIPFVAISYEFKMNELARLAGMSDYAVQLEELAMNDVVTLTKRLNKYYDDIVQRLQPLRTIWQCASQHPRFLLYNKLNTIRYNSKR